jgi:hypothetical protein
MAMAEAMMPKTLPGGGLASFLTSNMDEIDDSVLAFGRPNGINSMRDVAERMAQMGRGGDNFVVHASEREMMVPREVVENNPQLRRQIMQSIAAEGADPNAYIVGNDANSINPMTGQREFFLKKLVKGIKNVVKKVAPIVLPIALNFLFPGMGAVAAGALGSGIGTLIQGGNVRDAFRSALIGGAAGGLYSGISGAMRGQGFMAGVREGLIGQPNMRFFELNPSVRNMFGGAQAGQLDVRASSRTPAVPPVEADVVADAPRTLGQRVQDLVMPKPAMTTEQLAQEAGRIAAANPGLDPNTIYESLVSSQPTAMARFAKPALLAGGAAALAGAFNPVEQEAPPTPGYDQTSSELLAANPELYSVGRPGPTPFVSYSDIAVPTSYASAVPQMAPIYTPPINVRPVEVEPIRFAAMGGEMESFPRRMGAISGPGTETSDAVPAMLSDGEFVMTARAVRGAGNGDRERGVRRMYDMMRMFEGGVAR